MTAQPLYHLYSEHEKIKGIQSKLRSLNLKAKCTWKNDRTHLFFDSNQIAKLEDIGVKLGPNWFLCDGCDLCFGKPPHKRLRYVLYPPMILLPTGSATISDKEAQSLLAEHPNCTHIAVNAPVKYGDIVRSPEIVPIIGSFGKFITNADPTREDFDRSFWATSFQNGIHQIWAPLYTMFSRGNVTEKKRVLDVFGQQNTIADTTVIDLYSGIGYFSFPYAKQSPRIVYCWEINPWSIEGMMRAALKNHIKCRVIRHGQPYRPIENDKIIIFAENNQYAMERIDDLDLSHISHINMGLLPDAREGIPVAIALSNASKTKPVIHLHENVRHSSLKSWSNEMERVLSRQCLHVEKIKQFSPGVYHVCGDFA